MTNLFRWLAAVLVLGCVALAAPQDGHTQEPVCDDTTFWVEPMASSTHRVGDKSVLFVHGGVDAGAGDRISRAIRNTRSYDEVWLCSPGGDVQSGRAIGRALSSARATVRIRSGHQCVSACTIATLGGYARIIEDGAAFVIHASSSFLRYGETAADAAAGTPGATQGQVIFNCTESGIVPACRAFADGLRSEGRRECGSQTELQSAGATCSWMFAQDRSRDHFLLFNAGYLNDIGPDRDKVRAVAEIMMQDQEANAFEAIQYYQEMLLDRRTDLINGSGYRKASQDFGPLSIYNPSNRGLHARNLDADVAALAASGSKAEGDVIWQRILTDIELSTATQLTEFLLKGGYDLGPAGMDAVKIMDATFVCQIQGLCQLEPHQLNALGYNNMYDFN